MEGGRLERGLECVVGKARLVLPAGLIEGVVELEIGVPPPLARRWVAGLGRHEDKAVLCVTLIPQPQPKARTVKAVLFRVEDSEIGWLFEVSSVRSFVMARRVERTTPPPPGVPSWVGGAEVAGQVLGWVDVTAMVKELAGSA